MSEPRSRISESHAERALLDAVAPISTISTGATNDREWAQRERFAAMLADVKAEARADAEKERDQQERFKWAANKARADAEATIRRLRLHARLFVDAEDRLNEYDGSDDGIAEKLATAREAAVSLLRADTAPEGEG